MVIRTPQMMLQQYLSTLPYLQLPSGNLQTQFLSILWCYLPISSSVFLSFLLLSLSPAKLSLSCQMLGHYYNKTTCICNLLTNVHYIYRKFPKYSDTQKNCFSHSKIWTMWLYHRVMSPNNADGMANSVDTDQTPPPGAVWSGSALFAQAYLSKNLGSLR